MNPETGVPLTARARGKIAPEKLAHIVLRSADAARLVDWYCTVLEAQVALSNPAISFLTYDEEHHRIAIAQTPGVAPARSATGLDHFAFTYRDADELFATYDRLKAIGIAPFWCINHGPTLSFYYRDPDGNRVELQIDLFADVAATNAWFAQSDFAANPIGVTFEPDALIARYRAGEDRNTLFARQVIDPALIMAQLPAGFFEGPTAAAAFSGVNP